MVLLLPVYPENGQAPLDWRLWKVGQALAQVFAGPPSDPRTEDVGYWARVAMKQPQDSTVDPTLAGLLDPARRVTRQCATEQGLYRHQPWRTVPHLMTLLNADGVSGDTSMTRPPAATAYDPTSADHAWQQQVIAVLEAARDPPVLPVHLDLDGPAECEDIDDMFTDDPLWAPTWASPANDPSVWDGVNPDNGTLDNRALNDYGMDAEGLDDETLDDETLWEEQGWALYELQQLQR